MQSKLSDALVFASRLRKQRDRLKQKLSRKYCENKSKHRRVLDSLVKVYRSKKEIEMNDAKKKIDHYISREKLDKSLKKAPLAQNTYSQTSMYLVNIRNL